GSNYGFLNRKPSTASLFDLMGPWPWYVVVATVLVLAVWALMSRSNTVVLQQLSTSTGSNHRSGLQDIGVIR
ncbi:YwaF family protein, partial [Mycobacteroides abscessus]|uniref:YwaF family protein n=1 Tax=Mycobacteroides abscessus TaxID=36809 RepID=UPI000AAB1F9C